MQETEILTPTDLHQYTKESRSSPNCDRIHHSEILKIHMFLKIVEKIEDHFQNSAKRAAPRASDYTRREEIGLARHTDHGTDLIQCIKQNREDMHEAMNTTDGIGASWRDGRVF